MLKKIPIGIDDFSKIVDKDKNYLFVDKSLMIKELMDNGIEVSLIVRPRRWGKTLNMSMIQHFFAPEVNGFSTKGIFNNLKISNESKGAYIEKYQGKHPVIYISFKDAKKSNFDDFLEKTKGLVQEICNQHYVLESSIKLSEEEKNIFRNLLRKKANHIEVCDSLKTLSVLLYKHYESKIFILIDEYDSPLNAAYGQPYFDDLVNFLKGMFGAALKGNHALEKGIMTGILRLSRNKMLSDINNLTLYSLMEKQYSEYFGFSEDEVKSLFKESRVNNVDINEVKHWYNGYRSGNFETVYNPWSILNCIYNQGELKPYWIKTGDEELLKKALLESNESVREKLNILLTGEYIESIVDEYLSFDQIKNGDDEVLWSLLWALGYLKTVGTSQLSGTRSKYRLTIPNHEVERSYEDVFQTFVRSFNRTKYDSFLKNLVEGNVEKFSKDLAEFMLSVPSTYDLTHETNYHILLLAWVISLKETHNIHSNKEMGLGRPDIVLVPRSTNDHLGIVIEFKRAEKSKDINVYKKLAIEGLQQINEKKYDVDLMRVSHVKEVLKLCVVFYGKEFICESIREKKNDFLI